MYGMSVSIQELFSSMASCKDFEQALELINGIDNEIPPPSLINNIIFKILMENCEERLENEANVYLCNYLMLLPPKSSDFQYYYRDTLEDKKRNFDSIWDVFSHLVKSCFRHYNILRKKNNLCYPELVKYPNCDILIDFYTQMLTKFLSLDNDLFEDDPEERFSILLGWINKVYKLKNLRSYPVLDCLHLILDKKVNSDVLHATSSDKFKDIVNLLLDKCPDVFNNAEKCTGFFSKSNLPHVELRICQHKLHQLIFQEKLSNGMNETLTLKTIIYNYFCSANKQEGNARKTHLSNSLVKCATKDSKQLKQLFSVRNTEGDTKLHEFCRKNKYGDLFELLLSDPNLMPNAKNDVGFTPLHIACLFNCHYCVRFLLEEVITDEKVDVTATNKNGLTALHCAAHADSLDGTQILLKYGGAELTIAKDKFGKKPVNYAKSKKLKKLLVEAESTIPKSTDDNSPADLNFDSLTIPVMKDNNDLSIFLHYLYTILCNYLNMFNLYNCKKDGICKLSHKNRECHHYVKTPCNNVCDEDASIFEHLPRLLDVFLAHIQSDNNNNEIEVRLNLLPWMMLRKRLDN